MLLFVCVCAYKHKSQKHISSLSADHITDHVGSDWTVCGLRGVQGHPVSKIKHASFPSYYRLLVAWAKRYHIRCQGQQKDRRASHVDLEGLMPPIN